MNSNIQNNKQVSNEAHEDKSELGELEAIFHGLQDGVFSLTAVGDFIFVNKAFSNIAGYSDAETLKHINISEINLPSQFTDFIVQAVENIAKGSFPMEKTLPMFNTDEQLTLVQIQLNLFQRHEGESRGIIGTIKDITSHNSVKNKLRKANIALHQQEKIPQQQNIQQAKQLEHDRTSIDLKKVTRILSHDLKTPIRGIGYLTDWLGKNIDEIDEKGRNRLNLLLSRSETLDGMLNELVTFLQIDQKQEEKTLVDLNLALNTVLENLKPPENILINIVDLPIVVCYQSQISRLFEILIENAILSIGTKLGKITVTYQKRENNLLEFQVKDDGSNTHLQGIVNVFKLFSTITDISRYKKV